MILLLHTHNLFYARSFHTFGTTRALVLHSLGVHDLVGGVGSHSLFFSFLRQCSLVSTVVMVRPRGVASRLPAPVFATSPTLFY
jgi:hypothetical protein